MIFPYHVGAWEVLNELGLLTDKTPVAGASAGALVAAFHACGLTPADGGVAGIRL
jgi:predicted acylesterase/phospholipase RssA